MKRVPSTLTFPETLPPDSLHVAPAGTSRFVVNDCPPMSVVHEVLRTGPPPSAVALSTANAAPSMASRISRRFKGVLLTGSEPSPGGTTLGVLRQRAGHNTPQSGNSKAPGTKDATGADGKRVTLAACRGARESLAELGAARTLHSFLLPQKRHCVP